MDWIYSERNGKQPTSLFEPLTVFAQTFPSSNCINPCSLFGPRSNDTNIDSSAFKSNKYKEDKAVDLSEGISYFDFRYSASTPSNFNFSRSRSGHIWNDSPVLRPSCTFDLNSNSKFETRKSFRLDDSKMFANRNIEKYLSNQDRFLPSFLSSYPPEFQSINIDLTSSSISSIESPSSTNTNSSPPNYISDSYYSNYYSNIPSYYSNCYSNSTPSYFDRLIIDPLRKETSTNVAEYSNEDIFDYSDQHWNTHLKADAVEIDEANDEAIVDDKIANRWSFCDDFSSCRYDLINVNILRH